MQMKPDDYFNNGLMEMARFGRHTILKNNMSTEQYAKVKTTLVQRYPKLKKKIDRLVRSIRKQVCKCDPVQLLTFSSDMFLMSNLGISSEIQSSKEDIYVSRMTEYIQSIIVSSPIKYRPSRKDPSLRFFWIQRNIVKLYELIDNFYFSWAASTDKLYPDYDEEIRNTVVESQFLYTVRGQRYQIFEIEYFEKLLKAHNEIFVSLFGISCDEIIDGIKKLQYALSQGKLDAINDLGELMDDFFECGEGDINQFKEENPEAGKTFAENFFGTKLRNVIDVTGWPEKFVKSLSWGINECVDFYDKKEFGGWPIIDLPIQKRPFIKIGNSYYCFDYYSFMDNFYRALQKAVSREQPDYKWSDFQKEASESMVADVFSQILPGCVIHRDNYYPKNKSIKNLNENDILVTYAKTLIIVEVKAGSFVFTSPIRDFDNHIVSYRNLIEKADHQCKKIYDYLSSNDNAILYNQDGSVKEQIDMTKIDDVFMVCVTIDNINDFAARAEKLSFLKLKCNAISVSIDDLMVYREYFDSSLVFLHFLNQRRQATLEDKLALNDELDHLGMYIKHNMYCIQLKDYPVDAQIRFHGYREELDNYFCKLYHPQLMCQKPVQELPRLYLDIINYLEKNDIKNKVEVSNYLLNFSTEAKEQLCQYIEYALRRQKQIGNMIAISTGGDDEFSLRYTAFVEQPKINTFTEEYKRDYVLSTMIWNTDDNRVLLDFKFDNGNNLVSMNMKQYALTDISETESKRLLSLGKSRADMRLSIYLKQQGEISHDDMCPCGSGKTYGECCSVRLGDDSRP